MNENKDARKARPIHRDSVIEMMRIIKTVNAAHGAAQGVVAPLLHVPHWK